MLDDPLTTRERQILILLSEHYANKEIAARLSLSRSTVKNHVHSIFVKLDARNRRDVVVRARDLCLIDS